MEKVGNILTYFKKELANSFDEREVSSWAYLSINHLLGFLNNLINYYLLF